MSHDETTDAAQTGFTLVELVVVTTLLLVVLGAVLGVLESLTATEHTTSTRIDDAQAARIAMAQFSHDVRGASAVLPGPTLGAFATTLDLRLADGSQTQVEWAYDPGQETLTRYVVPAGQTRQPTSVLPGVASASFALLDRAGVDLTTRAWATAGDVVRCAAAVTASVAVGIHPRLAPQTLTVQDAVTNQGWPGGCP